MFYVYFTFRDSLVISLLVFVRKRRQSVAKIELSLRFLKPLPEEVLEEKMLVISIGLFAREIQMT